MESGTMLAFHGDAATKQKYLDRVEQHRKADQIVHGTYWQNGKGCAVGCTVHSANHGAFETELGIPRTLARLEDMIFESLKNGEAQDWPGQFLDAPLVGADLSMVWPRFALWLLGDPDGPVVLAAANYPDVKASVEGVVALYREWVETGIKPAIARWSAARWSAARWSAARWSAAAAAADAAAAAAAAAADAADAAAARWSAAAAAAADAADAAAARWSAAAAAATAAAADAAAAAAAAAADAAADAAARWSAAAAAATAAADADARERFWRSARDQLLALMREAPVASVAAGAN
jgi:hypothetical protein